MKTAMKIVLIIALVLIFVGVVGGLFFGRNYGDKNEACPLLDEDTDYNRGGGMMHNDNDEFVCPYEDETSYNAMMGRHGFNTDCPYEDANSYGSPRGSMMGRYYNNDNCPYEQ